MATAQRRLLRLYERPYEPITSPSGPGNTNISFDDIAVETRIGGPVQEQLGRATSIPRGAPFSFFLKSHREAAKDLTDFFLKSNSPTELVEAAARVRDLLNEPLFIYSLSFTILRKPEMRELRIPSLIETFPNWFVPSEELKKRQQPRPTATTVRTAGAEEEVLVIEYGPEFTGSVARPEHRVSYWREDYALNSHHWHWHLVNPINMGVARDRKGELFYYMHNQMMARYNNERLSLGLVQVKKVEVGLGEVVEDGYFSKLTINNSGRAWGSRQDRTLPQDVRRRDLGLDNLDISQLELWKNRLLEAIHQGSMVDRSGNRVALTDDLPGEGKRGIDLLSDALESDSELSINPIFYGDLHNMGHIVLAVSHDPEHVHKEEIGVMGDTATAIRDPVFFRWHKFVDNMCQTYKLTQPPYTEAELSFNGVVVKNVAVLTQGQREVNKLFTGWNFRVFEASRGLDFSSDSPVRLRMTHLDHLPFHYHINVTNETPSSQRATLRVFLAAREAEHRTPLSYMDQRLLWMEMDKFTADLNPGDNHIKRASTDSAVTNPNEFTFRELEDSADRGMREQLNFCNCGWPQHLLLPRGRQEGMTFQLLVMITDFEKDKVEQNIPRGRCANGVSFCGILDAKYPDSRPMGFPFDRQPPVMLAGQQVTSAADLARLSNVLIQDVTITFKDELLQMEGGN